MEKTRNTDTDVEQLTREWSPIAKTIATLLFMLHLLAVFAAPWSSPPPSSGLAQEVGRFFHPYTQSLAIDKCYRLFAPDPEPSHIVR